MAKNAKKLSLKRESLKTLTTELKEVNGGVREGPPTSYGIGFP